MTYSRWTTAALGIGFAGALIPLLAIAFDIGGSNGISVNGNGSGLNVSVGGTNGINATVGGSSNVANVSVGSASGVSSAVDLERPAKRTRLNCVLPSAAPSR